MTVGRPHFLLFADARDGNSHDCRPQGRWQFILEATDGRQRVSVADEEPQITGERLQLLSVVRGLEALDQPSRVTLITTSRYVARGIRFGLDAWRQSDWRWERFGSMVPIKNQDLWQRLDQALQVHRVEHRCLRFDTPHPPRTSREAASPVATTGPHFPRRPPGKVHRSRWPWRQQIRGWFSAWRQEPMRWLIPHCGLAKN